MDMARNKQEKFEFRYKGFIGTGEYDGEEWIGMGRHERLNRYLIFYKGHTKTQLEKNFKRLVNQKLKDLT